MAQISITDIMRMMQQQMGQVSNTEADAMKAGLAGAAIKGMPKFPVSMEEEMQKRMAQNPMETALSLSANEMQPNYADGQMPLYTGGLLQNPQGDMVDPQQFLNIAYDMSAPREMRINAIERLRALGVI
jgi:hypothetical protein